MIQKWEGWMAVTMDQYAVIARVRDACLDDVKAILIKEKEK